jgi:hypothetical protein
MYHVSSLPHNCKHSLYTDSSSHVWTLRVDAKMLRWLTTSRRTCDTILKCETIHSCCGSNMVCAISLLLSGQSCKQTYQLDLILGKEDIRKASLTTNMSCCERSKCSVLRALLPVTSKLRAPIALVPLWHGRFGTPNSCPFGFCRFTPLTASTLASL